MACRSFIDGAAIIADGNLAGYWACVAGALDCLATCSLLGSKPADDSAELLRLWAPRQSQQCLGSGAAPVLFPFLRRVFRAVREGGDAAGRAFWEGDDLLSNAAAGRRHTERFLYTVTLFPGARTMARRRSRSCEQLPVSHCGCLRARLP